MKQTILILFLFFSAILSGQDVYVDLNKLFNGNGTQENPLNDLPGELLANTTYWVKAGTEKKVKNSIRVKAPNPNITIRKWGGGVTTEDNPLFWSDIGDFKILDVHEHHLTIDGINFHGSGVGQAFVVALGSHLTIKNVKAWGFYSPVRVYGHFWNHPYVDYPAAADQKVTIENCEFFEAGTDGIFIRDCDNITIRNTKIYKVNQDFFVHGASQNDAPGDCIQLENEVANFHIEGCFLDRSDTGNKFCFIANGHKDKEGTKVIVNNTMIPPANKGAGGAGIYLSGNLTGALIENNTIIHPEGDKVSSMYLKGYGVTIRNNRIYNPGSIWHTAHGVIENNTFYGTTLPLGPGYSGYLIQGTDHTANRNEVFPSYDEIIYPDPDHDWTVPDDGDDDPVDDPDPCENCPGFVTDTIYITNTVTDTVYITTGSDFDYDFVRAIIQEAVKDLPTEDQVREILNEELNNKVFKLELK